MQLNRVGQESDNALTIGEGSMQRRIVFTAIVSLASALCIGPALADGSVLVDSIITSTKTDKPPRFCWVSQYISTSGDNKGEWVDRYEDSAQRYLEDFRGGHLDFGPNFDETNIVVDHWGLDHGKIRLHRVPCPPPEHSMRRGDPVGDELLAARLDALVDDPETRAQLTRLLGHHHDDGLLDHVTIGVGIGVGGGHDDRGGHHGGDRRDRPAGTAAPGDDRPRD